MTGRARSSNELDESSAAVINIGATKPKIMAQVHSIANRENREKMGTMLVILPMIHVNAVPSGAIGSYIGEPS